MAVTNQSFSRRGDVDVGAHQGNRPDEEACPKFFDLEANDSMIEYNGNGAPRFSTNGKFMHYEERAAIHEIQDLAPSTSSSEENCDNRPQKRDRKWALMFALVLLVDATTLAVYLSGGMNQKHNRLTTSPESVTNDVIASSASADLQNTYEEAEVHPNKKKHHTHAKKEHPKSETKKPHKHHTHENKDHPNTRPGHSSFTSAQHVEVNSEALLHQPGFEDEDPLEEQSIINEQDVTDEEVLHEPSDDSSESVSHEQSVHNIFAPDLD